MVKTLTSQVNQKKSIQAQIWVKNPPFPYLGLGLEIVLGSYKSLAQSSYISLHVTMRVVYYFYLCVLLNYYHTNKYGGVLGHPRSSQLLPHYQIRGSVRVSFSGLPTLYSFRIISNDILSVNRFPLFITTLNFEL